MIGETLSHYRVLSPLGSGGMGVVYEGEDTRLGRRVAIKLLPPDAGADAQAMERFFREARIVSSLNHAHICTLYDIGEQDGRQFMVMELLDGETLKTRLARGPLPLDDVLELGGQMADALDAAHAQGVVHRDIKPANLFVNRRGQLKVLDFGIAKLSESSRGQGGRDLAETSADEQLTTVGSSMGTISYMSPEQARGQELDARSDLFSVGIVLYEMTTGRQPFAGATPATVFEGLLTKRPEAPSAINAGMPPELDRIIFKALDKDRETRYQSAADIRADLKRLKRDTESGQVRMPTGAWTPAAGTAAAQSGSVAAAGDAAVPQTAVGGPASGPAIPARRSTRSIAIAAAVLLVAAAAAGVWYWRSSRTPVVTSRDTVVLTHFVNRTNDPVFDETLVEALGVQLRQSPYLNLLSEQQVQATLRLMGQDAAKVSLTPEMGRDLCQRAGGKAALSGTIASLGAAYLLTLTAHDCVSGAVLAESQSQVASKEEVIRGLGAAATEFRGKLGESLASIERFDSKIEEATTPSLDALKAYTQGTIVRRTKGDADSIPFFKRAIELDPEFALAYARLGTVYSNTGNAEESRTVTRRAYDLRHKVSERERLYVEARYHTIVERDVEKSIAIYKLLIASYPTEWSARNNIAVHYRQQGKPEEAIPHLLELIRGTPDQPLSYQNLGYCYLDLGKLEEAKKAFEQSLALVDATNARTGLFQVATLLGDRALADAQVAALKGRRDETVMLATRAQAAAHGGRMHEAAALMQDLERRSEGTPRRQLAQVFLATGIFHAITGLDRQARDEVARVERLGIMSDDVTDEALALAAILGDASLAAKYGSRARALVKSSIKDPVPLARAEAQIDALTALADRRYDAVVDLLDGRLYDNQQAEFILGVARLQRREWPAAIEIFKHLIERRTRFGMSPAVAVAHVYLARVYVATGNMAAARPAYEEALRIWKDADADLPLLVEAKAEYGKLSGS